MAILKDYSGKSLRLNKERLTHIKQHPEMKNELKKIKETVKLPDEVRASLHDKTVHLYYKKYLKTPVGEKFMLVICKVKKVSPFIITAFFTDSIKSGKKIYWRI